MSDSEAGPTSPAGRTLEADPTSEAGPARRPRRRLRSWLLSGIAVVVVLAVGGTTAVLIARRDPRGEAALAGAIPARTVPRTANGVFTGAELARAQAYRTWFGGDLDRVVEFSDRDNWAQIADPQYMISQWKGSGFRLVFSLAMLPQQDPTATIRTGATGAYNQYYRELAQNLVTGGQANAILRLGWEFNLDSSRWSGPDPAAFIQYWRQIVTTMRSVPGQRFQFDWNPNNGKAKYDAVEYYPGNAVVDYIGVDAYDVSWAWGGYPYPGSCDDACRARHQSVAWNKSIYGGKRGLAFWSAFAQHRGKPMSLPEWGLWSRPDGHGGGDDPAYLERMHSFVADPANGVAFQSYFEFNGPDGPHRLMTTFASSGTTFRALFAHP